MDTNSVIQLHAMEMNSKKNTQRKYILFSVCISALLVLFGHIFVLQRQADTTSPYLSIRGDSNYYMDMVEKNYSKVPPPFRYRILVPALASILPLESVSALKIITYVSLFCLYICLFWIGRIWNLSLSALCIGIGMYYSSLWQLYQFHNPYLPSSFSICMMALMIIFGIKKRFIPYMIALVVGILSHESTLFLAPLWFLTQDRKKGAWAVIAGISTYAVTHIALSSGDYSKYLIESTKISAVNQNLKDIAMNLFGAWSFLWLLGILGILVAPKKQFEFLYIPLVLLGLGGIISLFFATDIGRIFLPLTVVFPIAITNIFSIIKSKIHISIGILIAALQALTIANVLFGNPELTSIRIILAVTGGVYSIVIWKDIRYHITFKENLKNFRWKPRG